MSYVFHFLYICFRPNNFGEVKIYESFYIVRCNISFSNIHFIDTMATSFRNVNVTFTKCKFIHHTSLLFTNSRVLFMESGIYNSSSPDTVIMISDSDYVFLKNFSLVGNKPNKLFIASTIQTLVIKNIQIEHQLGVKYQSSEIIFKDIENMKIYNLIIYECRNLRLVFKDLKHVSAKNFSMVTNVNTSLIFSASVINLSGLILRGNRGNTESHGFIQIHLTQANVQVS